MRNPLRMMVSDKVTNLHQILNESGVVLSKSDDDSDIETHVKQLQRLGGIMSGGSVLAYMYDRSVKDFDIYFNEENAFLKACKITKDDPYVDVCWYFNKPHELHDIAFVMCDLHPNGKLEITEQAQHAIDTGVSDIYHQNIIYPNRTAKRLYKYHTKYGIRFKPEHVLALGAFDVSSETIHKLLKTVV